MLPFPLRLSYKVIVRTWFESESALTTFHIQSDHYLRRPLNIFNQNIQSPI